MNTPLPWVIFILTVLGLGLVGHHFSLRTLRIVSASACVAAAVAVTWYGLALPARASGSLFNAFTRGANAIAVYLFHAAPGQTGWIILAAALVIGYRELEAWTLRGHARCLDTSALAVSRADTKPSDTSGDDEDVISDKHYDRLAAELKFRLPAVEVRAPSILPGGSRAGGLASIAEASGFAAGGLAGAMINFFGMLWPGPRQLRVRVWMERTPGHTGIDDVSRVTVHLDDPRTGMSIATKTLAACGVDDAASMVAGYVARHVFAGDPAAPPWCTGAADGRDLGALLLARQVRHYPESEEQVCGARHQQIAILSAVTRSPQCAGVTRYELAQLCDLTGRHVEALLMHAVNREQFPHFYRGRYRLAMSLEMIASASSSVMISSREELDKFNKALKILWKCGVLKSDTVPHHDQPRYGEARLTPGLRTCLLKAAWDELLAIRWYLSLPSVIWNSFWRRDERAILRPYWRHSYRQSFHDGVDAALLLVAVRQAQADPEADGLGRYQPPRAKTIGRVAAAVVGDSSDFTARLGHSATVVLKDGVPPVTKSMRTRHWFRPYCTRSWQAGYNLACAYAALIQIQQAKDPDEDKLRDLTGRLVSSLEYAFCNPECEMERPGDWIGSDPDFSFLHPGNGAEKNKAFTEFEEFLTAQKQRDYPSAGPGEAAGPVADLVTELRRADDLELGA